MNVSDIHRQILQWTFGGKAPEANKIPLKWRYPYSCSIKQFCFLHQPVNLFMINDPAHLPQLTSHVPVAVTTKLLGQRAFDIFNHYCVFNQLAITVQTMCAWFDSFAQ